MRVQRISFNHSDIPPSVRSAIVEPPLWAVLAQQRASWLDLVLRVLRASKSNLVASANGVRWDKPAAAVAHEDEDVIAARWVEPLHHTVPALVPSARAEPHLPTVFPEEGRGLHLDADELSLDLGDYVVVGAVPNRDIDARPAACQPHHRGCLTQISLLKSVHVKERTFALGRNQVRAPLSS